MSTCLFGCHASTAAVLNLWVATPLERSNDSFTGAPYQLSPISHIYITIYNGSKVAIISRNDNSFMVGGWGVSSQREELWENHSIRKVENRCSTAFLAHPISLKSAKVIYLLFFASSDRCGSPERNLSLK